MTALLCFLLNTCFIMKENTFSNSSRFENTSLLFIALILIFVLFQCVLEIDI